MFKSVAIVFVSSHILPVVNENKTCKFLLDQMNLLNYQVEKVTVIRENEAIVTNELVESAKLIDIIIVIGELRTGTVIKALANVFSDELKLDTRFANIFNDSKECGDMYLPSMAKLLTGDETFYPVIYMQRIFVLQKDYVEKACINVLCNHLEQYRLEGKFTKVINVHVNGNTNDILKKVNKLGRVCAENKGKMLTVTLINSNFDKIVECERILRKELGINFIESREESNVFDIIYNSKEIHIQEAIHTIEECFLTYGPENVFLSFNGGKDCTVLLHLVYTVLKVKYPNYNVPIFCLYVRSEKAFPEQDKFISQCQIYYNLDIVTVSLGMKEALKEVLLGKPHLSACFMGTRRTDPFSGELQKFQVTDSDWPKLMRVSPLLEWHYCDIWDYLLYLKIPYCKLYDLGFTSLGNSSNTIKNPCLSYHDIKSGSDMYLPAYKMTNESKERSGRNLLI